MDLIKTKPKGHRGQVTFVNLIAFFITLLIFLLLYPVISGIIETTILGLPVNEYTGITSTILRLIPVVIGLALMITVLNYANPPATRY